MKETRIIMGMPVTVEIVEGHDGHRANVTTTTTRGAVMQEVFDYFTYIDQTFSTYKPESEMMRINRGELAEAQWSDDMSIILMLSEETKQRTNGLFDIRRPDGSVDPSGIVKGWAIWQAAQKLRAHGIDNFYLDVGGDIQTSGTNAEGKPWTVGIKNPFRQDEIVKTIVAREPLGIATSGTYIRGEHIYNPKTGAPANEIVSLTVIGPNIYEADRFATAAFAAGAQAIHIIESLPDLEGYMIGHDGTATMTTSFEKFTAPSHN